MNHNNSRIVRYSIIHEDFKSAGSLSKIKDTALPDVYELYCYENSSLIKYGIASIPNMKVSKNVKKMFKNNMGDEDVVVSCKYSNVFKKWVPLKRVWTDRITSSKTIEKFLKNLNKK